jgi:hypothetical protein
VTPSQFKALLKSRGYTQAEVAKLWKISAGRMSQIARNPNRLAMYEYALWAVPPKRIAAAVQARRLQAARAAAGHDSHPPPVGARRVALDAATDLTAIDDVYVVAVEQGEHLPEGCEGVITARDFAGGQWHVSILFDNGYRERFPQSFLEDPSCFLTATGRTRSPAP